MPKLTNATLKIHGKSLTAYQFELYSLTTNFPKKGAVYIFTRRITNADGINNHRLVYCGKTNDLTSRFNNHHKTECFQMHSANCICVLLVSTEHARTQIETDILNGNLFSCNETLN